MAFRSIRGLAASLLAACASVSLAAPPAPQATASAGGVKQLRFGWDAVSGATGYELWFLANSGSQPVRFFQMPGSQRSVINNVSVHLLDWSNARYWVSACDSSGCTASTRLAVNNLVPDTIGVFNPPAQQASSQFGYEVALSGDGTTLAAAAPFEASDDANYPKGSAYIYKKSAGSWILQATIPFGVRRQGSTRNVRLALNGDGKVLAVALPGDKPFGSQTYIGSGAAKVFRAIEDDGWRQDVTIAMETGFEFGSAEEVLLDATGKTLAVWTPRDGSGFYIYTFDGSGTWSHTGTARGHGIDADRGSRCGGGVLSGDGKVLAYSCGSYEPSDSAFEVHAAPDWGIRDTIPVPGDANLNAVAIDSTGNLLATTAAPYYSSGDVGDVRTEVYRRVSGAYQREAVLRRGAWEGATPQAWPNTFGSRGALSADGKLLALSYPGDHGAGTGSLAPPLTAGTKATGAVYVYERRTNGWNLRRVVKPGRAGAGYETGTFGSSIAFGDNGKTLAVGQPAANNNGGVVWLY